MRKPDGQHRILRDIPAEGMSAKRAMQIWGEQWRGQARGLRVEHAVREAPETNQGAR